MGISRAIAVVICVTVCVLTSSAAAQNPQAAKLFDEGRELAKQEKWDEACDKFQKSLELDPAPGTKLNLGDCLEKQGQVRRGWLMFEEAARDFHQLQDPREKFASDRAREAQGKLATLVLKVGEASLPGMKITIGDRPATPQTEIVERVDPGPIEISVSAPDKKPFETSVSIAAGKTFVVDVPELADLSGNTVAPIREEPATTTSSRHKRVVIAFVLGGAGAVGLLASGLVGLSAKSSYDSVFDDGIQNGGCDESDLGPLCSEEGKSRIDDAGSKADLATGLAIAGIALAAAGVIVYVTAPKETDVAVSPMASTDGSLGVSLTGRF